MLRLERTELQLQYPKENRLTNTRKTCLIGKYGWTALWWQNQGKFWDVHFCIASLIYNLQTISTTSGNSDYFICFSIWCLIFLENIHFPLFIVKFPHFKNDWFQALLDLKCLKHFNKAIRRQLNTDDMVFYNKWVKINKENACTLKIFYQTGL